MISSAEFSACGLYRYTLTRIWDESKPLAGWCLLNPSTANHEADDPTSTRVTNFTRDLGYGGFILVNAFAARTTDPKELPSFKDPIGPENNDYIQAVALKTDIMILGWGNGGNFQGRGGWVYHKILRGRRTHCLAVTKSGQPGHPLYIKGTTEIQEFKWRVF